MNHDDSRCDGIKRARTVYYINIQSLRERNNNNNYRYDYYYYYRRNPLLRCYPSQDFFFFIYDFSLVFFSIKPNSFVTNIKRVRRTILVCVCVWCALCSKEISRLQLISCRKSQHASYARSVVLTPHSGRVDYRFLIITRRTIDSFKYLLSIHQPVSGRVGLMNINSLYIRWRLSKNNLNTIIRVFFFSNEWFTQNYWLKKYYTTFKIITTNTILFDCE